MNLKAHDEKSPKMEPERKSSDATAESSLTHVLDYIAVGTYDATLKTAGVLGSGASKGVGVVGSAVTKGAGAVGSTLQGVAGTVGSTVTGVTGLMPEVWPNMENVDKMVDVAIVACYSLTAFGALGSLYFISRTFREAALWRRWFRYRKLAKQSARLNHAKS